MGSVSMNITLPNKLPYLGAHNHKAELKNWEQLGELKAPDAFIGTILITEVLYIECHD